MDFVTEQDELKFASVMRRFYVYFLPLVFLFIMFASTEYFTDMKLTRGILINSETQYVKLVQRSLDDEIRAVISDMVFLSRLNETWDLLDDPKDERAWLMIAQEFLYFSEKKGVYEQIRIIGSDGNELIRVNFGNGTPYIVERPKLQNKSDSLYFTESFAMDIGGVYMSQFVIDMDDQEIGTEPTPVIRFATPLFASKGKSGVLIFDFRGSKLIESMYQAAGDISEHIALVNERGYWLSSPNSIANWNFSLNKESAFSIDYPDAWKIIKSEDNGSFVTDRGMFTFETVYPKTSALEFYAEAEEDKLSANNSRNDTPGQQWKIISRVSPVELNSQVRRFINSHFIPYGIVTLLIIAISFFLAQSNIRRRLVQEHSDYERRFLTTLDKIQMPVVRLDPNGNVLFCNPYLLSLLGWKKKEIIGRNWFETVVDWQARDEALQSFKNMTSGNTPPLSTNTSIRTRENQKRQITWNNTLSINPHGKVVTLTSIGQDITEQKRLQKEVDDRNREIARTQALTSMGRMASMIAHDLRNPLSSIKMTLQILGKRMSVDFSNEAGELSSIALEQVHYMEDILADLLQYSKPDAIKPEWLNINDVLNKSIISIQKSINEYNATLITEYQEKLPRVHADTSKLYQVFTNLMTNALQAANDFDRVPQLIVRTSLELNENMSGIKIEIIDNGPGIPPEQVEKIFDPFFTTRAKGTGLGLPIVKRIIDQHKGTISLSKTDDDGTCATVMLSTGPIELTHKATVIKNYE